MPMETIRIVIDAELLDEIDQAARRAGISRSAFFRDALRWYLRLQRIRDMEQRDRKTARKQSSNRE